MESVDNFKEEIEMLMFCEVFSSTNFNLYASLLQISIATIFFYQFPAQKASFYGTWFY